MAGTLTAQAIVQRIRDNLGVPWKDPSRDRFMAGDPATPVTGVATAFAPSIEVLRRAAASRKNLIITREAPYWSHEGYYGADAVTESTLAKDPAYLAKREILQSNQMVVWKFVDNWEARRVDGQLAGLARALKWEKNHRPKGSPPFQKGDAYFEFPETTAGGLIGGIKAALKLQGIRVIGDRETRVRKVALMPGLTLVSELGKILSEPGVDAVVAGEPVEWEAAPYFEDVIAMGQKKVMILLGQAASCDPGSGEVAEWLKTFVREVPVEWIPAGEPFWSLS